MKKLFPLLMLFGLTLFSCGSDEDSLQKIDQIMNIYIQDASGNNLLIPNKIGSYSTVGFNDELAPKDDAPISMSRKEVIIDSIYNLEYISGATREFVEDAADGSKIYKSDLEVSLIKKLSDTQNAPVVLDRLVIFYRSSANVFEVSRVLYNNQQVFTKIPDQPNTITIIK
ncbi:hypothetical protein OF897_02835 [Chryseobacterium formosus]|uniref:Uncharacterized protein n=1 Tax=Chryseobacterium formosus TaxID=1537363 RepID=A0ABT3XPM2_9FLAO|nr:hypothetical protein [Chryseobacterium formosus]MCX8522855.1 hypothetical protein [Chryseobacterium formosus]